MEDVLRQKPDRDVQYNGTIVLNRLPSLSMFLKQLNPNPEHTTLCSGHLPPSIAQLHQLELTLNRGPADSGESWSERTVEITSSEWPSTGYLQASPASIMTSVTLCTFVGSVNTVIGRLMVSFRIHAKEVSVNFTVPAQIANFAGNAEKYLTLPGPTSGKC